MNKRAKKLLEDLRAGKIKLSESVSYFPEPIQCTIETEDIETEKDED